MNSQFNLDQKIPFNSRAGQCAVVWGAVLVFIAALLFCVPSNASSQMYLDSPDIDTPMTATVSSSRTFYRVPVWRYNTTFDFEKPLSSGATEYVTLSKQDYLKCHEYAGEKVSVTFDFEGRVESIEAL